MGFKRLTVLGYNNKLLVKQHITILDINRLLVNSTKICEYKNILVNIRIHVYEGN